MIKKILLFSFLYTSILLLVGRFGYAQKEPYNKSKEAADSTLILEYDSLLVIHFHPTAQCSCCINVGNFSKKGLGMLYPELYKDRRIIFKQCNIDEDSSTANKYKIFGSALGFKKFLKGKEEFKEVESVWEFCEDEDKFLIDFQRELRSFVLGKKEGKSEKNPK
jgi:hypothetical protein